MRQSYLRQDLLNVLVLVLLVQVCKIFLQPRLLVVFCHVYLSHLLPLRCSKSGKKGLNLYLRQPLVS